MEDRRENSSQPNVAWGRGGGCGFPDTEMEMPLKRRLKELVRKC